MTRKRLLPSPSLIVAIIALVATCAGSATAASLITGKQIKKGTVTSKQIKNRTLRKEDLHLSATKALKGSRGEKGDTGTPGPVGPSDVYSTRASARVAADGATVLSLDVPAGSYLLSGKAMLLYDDAGPGQSEFECRLTAGAGSDRSRSTMTPFTRDTVPFQLTYQSAAASQLTMVCDGSNIYVEERSISALRVGAIH